MDNDYDYNLVILGDPKAQKRHRTITKGRGGHQLPFARTYDPSAIDKRDILRVVQAGAPEKPLDEPLRVDIKLYYQRPKGHYGTGRNSGKLKSSAPLWHTKKPDRDNADKIILDALSGIFWRDDSLICAGEITKQYSDKPRTEIYIKLIKENTK